MYVCNRTMYEIYVCVFVCVCRDVEFGRNMSLRVRSTYTAKSLPEKLCKS